MHLQCSQQAKRKNEDRLVFFILAGLGTGGFAYGAAVRDAQCEFKRAARPGIATGPYAAAVLFDDRSSDRQPHAHAIRLRREESVEHLVDIFQLDSGARILHRNEYLIGLVLARSYPQFATAACHGTQGLDAVHQKIHDNLLELDAVAIDRWKRRPEVEPQRYTINVDLPADQRDDVVDDFIDVELHGFERALLGQRTDARNHVARAS